MSRLFILCLLGILSIVQAVDISGYIQWNDMCPGLTQLGASRVILDNGELSAGVVRNGTFTIYGVPQGVYLLSMLSHDYVFDQMRLDVLEDSIEAHPYAPATPLSPAIAAKLPYPLVLVPRAKFSYYAPPETFDIMAMVKSPMVLMMIATAVMVLAMPYLMSNMDPESLEEFKEQQAKMAKMQSAVTSGDFKSGFSALMAGSEEPKEKEVAKTGTPGKTKGKGKRR